MIYIKKHISENGSVVAMCDESLIDKVLSEGEIVLDIKSYNAFYKGELVKKEKARDIIKDADSVYSANLVGKESVDVGLEAGIISKENIFTVKKIPYAHAYRLI